MGDESTAQRTGLSARGPKQSNQRTTEGQMGCENDWITGDPCVVSVLVNALPFDVDFQSPSV
jgi:hypothetical protein